MDSSIVTDVRFQLAAERLGISFHEMIGGCFLLWLHCYERRSNRLTIRQANASARLKQFAEALVAEELATKDGDEHVLIHGVEKRIEFLNAQAERGRKGGKKSSKSKRSQGKQTPSHSKSKRLATASGTAQANTPALSPDLALTPAPDLGVVASDLIDQFNRYFDRAYKPAAWSEHITAALEAGYTPMQIRGAMWGASQFCADRPDILANFSPKTVLRLKSRDDRNTLPQWLEIAEQQWREEHGAKSPPWQTFTEKPQNNILALKPLDPPPEGIDIEQALREAENG